MEQTGSGVISQNELMARLVQAKKVMNKVESGNFKNGQISEQISRSDDDDDYDMDNVTIYDQTPPQIVENMNVSKQPYNIDKINQSKLPESIKRAMIERPIVQPDISLSDGIDMKIIKGAKRLMEQENKTENRKPQTQQVRPQVVTSELINTLMPIMENMIRKVMDEKLNQLLSAQKTQSINENLVLKVGDSVFKGKITGVQSSK